MHKADDYHQRAAQYRLLSVTAQTPDLQAYYADLAQIWDRLAERWLTLEVMPGPDVPHTSLHRLPA